jgi:hypothetical protein
MRLRFLVEKQGESGDTASSSFIGRKIAFLVDPVKVPTVSDLVGFIAPKFNIAPTSKISLLLGDTLVHRDESIAIFKEDELVTVK